MSININDKKVMAAKKIDTSGKISNGGKKRRYGIMYNKWIVKNIPFYFFTAAIAIIYIANGHFADKVTRKINTTEKNLKEMEYEFKTVKRDVIFRSKESELAKAVAPMGLNPLMVPPVMITDTLVEGDEK